LSRTTPTFFLDKNHTQDKKIGSISGVRNTDWPRPC